MFTHRLFSTAFLLGALLFTGITFSGCSKESSTVEPAGSDQLSTLTLPDPALEPSDVDGCTLDHELRIKPPASDVRRAPLGGILRRLNLTEEQIASVKTLLASHEECATAALTDLRTAEEAILAPYKATRQELLDAVRAGTLTREAARTQLDSLGQAAHAALLASPERQAAADALKACRDTFFAAVADILTDEQKALLATWLENECPKDPKGRRPEPPRGSRPKP